jgi:hypothetical protein
LPSDAKHRSFVDPRVLARGKEREGISGPIAEVEIQEGRPLPNHGHRNESQLLPGTDLDRRRGGAWDREIDADSPPYQPSIDKRDLFDPAVNPFWAREEQMPGISADSGQILGVDALPQKRRH